MFHYKLRTLLILLAVGPIVLSGLLCAYMAPSLSDGPYFGPPPPAIRPGLNVPGLIITALLPLIVLGVKRFIFPNIRRNTFDPGQHPNG